MDKFMRYVEEVCYSCLGEYCFNKGLSYDKLDFAKSTLVDILTMRDDKILFNCRNSYDSGRVFIIKLLMNAYKSNNISKLDLKDIYRLDFNEFPNTKLALTQKGFLLDELIGAVINEKFRVPALLFNKLTELRMSDIVLSDSDSFTPINRNDVDNLMRRVNLQLLMYGYVNNFNVGFILDKLNIISNKILDIGDTTGDIISSKKTMGSFLKYILSCVFDLPLDVHEFETELNPTGTPEIVKDNINTLNELNDSTRLNALYQILGVNRFEDLVDRVSDLLETNSTLEESHRELQSTHKFLSQDEAIIKISEKDVIIKQLEERVNKLESELASANSIIDDKRVHISDLNREISKLRSDSIDTSATSVVSRSNSSISNTKDISSIKFTNSNTIIDETSKDDIDTDIENVVINYLNEHNVCIIGGHVRLLNSLRQVLKSSTIVEREDSIDDWTLKYKDIIIINTLVNYHKNSDKVRANRRNGQKVFIITANNYRQFITECYDYVCHLVDN